MTATETARADKTDARRAALIDRLVDHVLVHGLSASSLRPLARAAQTSDRMLLYYFKDKAAVFLAVLECISARLLLLMEARHAQTPLPFTVLRAQLAAVVLDDALWPYLRIWLEVASLAAHGDPMFRAIGERIGRGFLAWGSAQLAGTDPTRHAAESAQLLVMTEGLILLKSLGLDDVCRAAL